MSAKSKIKALIEYIQWLDEELAKPQPERRGESALRAHMQADRISAVAELADRRAGLG